MLTVAILAGGLATRLQRLTQRTPKSLISVAGRPFVFHQLELLRRAGAGRVVLCVGHLADPIREAVGDGRQFGLQVEYSSDGERLLGTGGAIKRALPLLGRAFFVLYGDSYLPCDFKDIERAYLESGAPAMMAIVRNDNRWDRSNVAIRDDDSVCYEKNSDRADLTHVDFGVSVFSRDVFTPIPADAVSDLAAICRELSLRRQLAPYEVSQRFYEIGSPQGIADTEGFLLAQDLSV